MRMLARDLRMRTTATVNSLGGRARLCKDIEHCEATCVCAQAGACGRGVLSIAQDCFYRDLSPAEREDIAGYNFDHPDAFDFAMISRTLRALRRGEVRTCTPKASDPLAFCTAD